jgi:hypothetical protein
MGSELVRVNPKSQGLRNGAAETIEYRGNAVKPSEER